MIRYEKYNDVSHIKKYFKNYQTEILELLDINAKYMQNYSVITYIFFDGKIPIGFITIDIPNDKNKSIFTDIYIIPEYRSKGLGIKIFQLIEKEIIKLLKQYNRYCIFATIEKDNTPSIKLFNKLGFKRLDDKYQTLLRKRKVLSKNEIRYVKCYTPVSGGYQTTGHSS